MPLRPATLEDATLICQWSQQTIERWQRLNAQGIADDLPCEQLSIYERWLHGGAWMSLETGILWLSHILRGAGKAWIATDETGEAMGYAEVFMSEELPPLGKVASLTYLSLSSNAPPDARDLILQELLEIKVSAWSVGISAYDEESLAFYSQYGFTPTQTLQLYRLHTASGQGFYKITDQPNPDASQIKGWAMPTGRLTNARHAWETHWTALWDAVPPIAKRRVHRLRCSASGHEAFLHFEESLYDPRIAEVRCWSMKAFASPLTVAIRDWAQRNGYRQLTLWADNSVATALGSDAEASPQQHLMLTRPL